MKFNFFAFGMGILFAWIILPFFSKFCVIELKFAGVQRDWIIYGISIFLTILSLSPIIWSIHDYIKHGQKTRIEHIKGFFSGSIIRHYLQLFWGAEKCMTTQGLPPSDVFCTKMGDIFGQGRLKQALGLLFVVGFVVLYFAFMGGLQLARETGKIAETLPVHYPLGLKPSITNLAAIFGAYTWIASDAIYRHRLKDFNSSDVFWYTLRLIVAIPVGEAVAAYAPMQTADAKVLDPGSTGPLLAFVVSMFSFTRIQQILGAFTNRAFNIQTTASEARDDVTIKLPGIDQSVADRLASEGVTTVAQLATADPVFLSSRTAIEFPIVLEYVDAAILWKFVGAKLLTLREFGWAGASDVIAFADNQDTESALAARIGKYQNCLKDVGKADADYAEAKTKATQAQQDNSLSAEQKQASQDLASQAQQALDDAKHRCDAARIQVAGGQAEEALFTDMAAQAGMKTTALREIKNAIVNDNYALFIYRMIQRG